MGVETGAGGVVAVGVVSVGAVVAGWVGWVVALVGMATAAGVLGTGVGPCRRRPDLRLF